MLYQLPNGRVIEMSTESFLDLDDQAVQELTGLGPGYSIEISNPFNKKFSSSSSKSINNDDEDHEVEKDLTKISQIDKLIDKDFHRDDT